MIQVDDPQEIDGTGSLTGRGGAAFPVHRNLAAVAAARGRKVAVANGAESELRQHGFVMLLVNSNGDPDLEATHIDVLRRRRVDGLIANLVSEDHPATLKAIRQLAPPLVLIDRHRRATSHAAWRCGLSSCRAARP